MEFTKEVVFVKNVITTQKASTVINVNQHIIVHMANTGMRLMCVILAIVSISTPLEIVQKKPENANVVKSSKNQTVTVAHTVILDIQTADHVNVIYQALINTNVKLLTENVHVNIILQVTIVIVVQKDFIILLLAVLVNVTQLDLLDMNVRKVLENVNVRATMQENNVIHVKMVTINFQSVPIAIAISKEQFQKFVTKILENVYVVMVMEDLDVINACQVTTDILTVYHAIVQLLVVFQQFVMHLADVLVYQTLVVNNVPHVKLVIISIQNAYYAIVIHMAQLVFRVIQKDNVNVQIILITRDVMSVKKDTTTIPHVRNVTVTQPE
jgi:hypothetical protein